MDLRTHIDIEPSINRISYQTPVMFIGSCFAASIGSKLEAGRLPVIINPSGTVYNPVSVAASLNNIIREKKFDTADLYYHNRTWLSFSHYTDFSGETTEFVLDKINRRSLEAKEFMGKARFLFITFGTARVFKFKETGEIVSNCHKLPSGLFERELLSVDDIVNLWNRQLDLIQSHFPELKIVFTISPVRHWKDGAHGNQVSKSVLFLAVEALLKHPVEPLYFPAYELLMDDLRDYRFYDDDMLHPSKLAVDYIWNAFSGCFIDRETMDLWNEAAKIIKGASHRFRDSGEKKKFAENMLGKISNLEKRISSIDFREEKKYFQTLIG